MRGHSVCLFEVNLAVAAFSVSFCSSWRFIDQSVVDLLFLLFLCDILSVLRWTVYSLLVKSKSPFWFVPLVFSTSSVGTLSIFSRGAVPFWKSFWIRVFFPLVFYSGMSLPSKRLFILISSLSWIEVNFKTSIYVCHHGQMFSNLVLFCVLHWVNWGFIFAFGPLSRYNSFSILFIHSAFLLCSPHSTLLENCLFHYHPVVGMSLSILLLLAGRIFLRCFGMFCFVSIVWCCLDIFLVFLLSPVPSDWFPRVLLLVLLYELLFAFRPNIFQCFSFLSSVFLVVVDFLSEFPV